MASTLSEQILRAFSYYPGITFIVGAGGKTSLLYALFHAWREPFRVLMTTTTRMAADQLLPEFAVRDEDTYEKTCQAIATHIHHSKGVFVYNRIEDGKLYGTKYPLESILDPISSECELDFSMAFVEADGAQNRLIKFPKAHEPVLSPTTDTHRDIIHCMNIGALGQPVVSDAVYNGEGLAAALDISPTTRLRPQHFAQLGQHRFESVPTRVFINGVRTPAQKRSANWIALQILAETPNMNAPGESVVIGDIDYRRAEGESQLHASWGRTRVIVLAAGMSRRMGAMKVLLPWIDGEPILAHILRKLCAVPLAPTDIVVVTGRERESVEVIARAHGVQTVHNPDYAESEMGVSLRLGLKSAHYFHRAAMIVLGDQPFLDTGIVRRVLRAYAHGRLQEPPPLVVAPSYERQRGHPILIDHALWDELIELPAEDAPRDVINRYADRTHWVNTQNANILRDLDTPEEYESALAEARGGIEPN